MSSLMHTEPRKLQEQLGSYMAQVQGYRLLDGFPRPHLMLEVDDEDYSPWGEAPRTMAPDRELIVGVLPHSMCNPRVEACGFCTFPHEQLDMKLLKQTVPLVCAEIERRVRIMGIKGYLVHALYFGGSTANLTPPDLFEDLVHTLETQFDLTGAEVTLEGVPRYFLTRRMALMERIARMHIQHRRISVGVQTFDPAVIEMMGRSHFGDAEVIAEVIREAHHMGFTVSGDIIINQPGQTREQMFDDVRQALDLGFDQICLYNMVLRSYLETPWSRDQDKLSALPLGEEAFENWTAVRDLLLAAGFVQTTLSNFERLSVIEDGKRFLYEEAGFKTYQYDALGFGPRALTFLQGSEGRPDGKWMNYYGAKRYGWHEQKVHPDWIRFAKSHFYKTPEDQLLTHMTRSLALLRIDRNLMKELTGLDPVDVHAPQIAAIEQAGLIMVTEDSIELTERGTFFSDSVIGLLSASREDSLRADLAYIRREREMYNSGGWGGGGM